VVGWSVRPQKNHLIWAIVLPIRELFMYIESATDLSSREEREAGIYIQKEQVIRTAEPDKKETQAGWPRSGFTDRRYGYRLDLRMFSG